MTKPHSPQPASTSALGPFLPGLLLLFVASGCSALIYEIVWFQLLQLVIGSSAVSLGVLLGTFMGGMCLGSLLLPRWLSTSRHPLRVYALLELLIGVIAIAVLHGMPYLDGLYTSIVGRGLPGILLRGVVAGICLLPPTMLMGATLPAIARWIETTTQGVSWLGFFYGGNIAGAVFGCLLAGFYLLRLHDMAYATYVAAAINTGVAICGFGLSLVTPHRGMSHDESAEPVERLPGAWTVYVAIALSGACALAAEVIWTRLLSLMLGATVYTFSIILAVFLVGLGIGSAIGSVVAREPRRARAALGFCQLDLAAAIAWAAYMLANSLPYWPIDTHLSSDPWISFQMDLARCFWAVLPAACLWGASFPLALAALATPKQDPGRLVGGVYAANTIGAILGALGASLVLVPLAGTRDAQRILIGVSAVTAFLMLAPVLLPLRRTTPFGGWSRMMAQGTAGLIVLVVATGLVVSLIRTVPPLPAGLIAYGRSLPRRQQERWSPLFVGEGMTSSVAVTELESGVRNFHVSGKVEASSEPQDMRLQRMLGHLPALIHLKPRSVLIVGCGAGVTSGSFVLYPGIERIVICEIEALVPKVVARHFGKENYNVVEDPRVQIVYDDARHYILTSNEKFDIITSDPIHPWVKGSAALYTEEYFEHCKQHLNPGGVITQWVPLYESTADVVKSEIATFFEVFPGGTIWSNDDNGAGYDVVLLGQAEPTRINADEIQKRLDQPDYAEVAQSLRDVGFHTVVGLFGTYTGQASELKSWLEGAEINHDRNLRLQYLAGMWLDRDDSRMVHEQMMSMRKFPEEIFQGTGLRAMGLRRVLSPTARDQQP